MNSLALAAGTAPAPTVSPWRYAALGLPLGFAALPVYVHVPRLYAEHASVTLAMVGVLLLATRLLDALLDPWLGQLSDAWLGRRGFSRRRLIGLALPPFALGVILLLAPPANAGPAWLGLALVLTYLGLSLASINHHAWVAELAGDDAQRTRFNAAREGSLLAGVIIAAAAPAALAEALDDGLRRLLWIFGPLLLLGSALTLGRALEAPGAVPPAPSFAPAVRLGAWQALRRDAVLRRLLALLACSGIAAAIPATLVLFYIADVLRLPQWQGAFLGLYFVSGALGLPLWVRWARRHGTLRAWFGAGLLAVFSFAGAALLGPGDGLAFAAICLVSGFALGAELALPASLLTRHLAQQVGTARGGAYFGLWHLVGKLNLALAAGIALPLVGWLGYRADGGSSAAAISALAWVYAALPAALKLVGLTLLWRWRGFFAEPTR